MDMEDILDERIRDLIGYLGEIKEMAKPLDGKQRNSLAAIIKTIVILLVSLKKSSNLGSYESPFQL